MLLLRGYAHLVMFTGAVDDLPVETRHLASDHGHGFADLDYLAVDADLRACGYQMLVVRCCALGGTRTGWRAWWSTREEVREVEWGKEGMEDGPTGTALR